MKYSKEDYIELYNEIDTDHSRGIDVKELIQFLQKNKMDPDVDRVRKYFTIYDKNKNGVLELPEWIELMDAIFYDRLQ